jgi:hypothetical protein
MREWRYNSTHIDLYTWWTWAVTIPPQTLDLAVREDVTHGQERWVVSCFRLVAQAKRFVCRCGKPNPGRPLSNHSLHWIRYICSWSRWCIQKLLYTRGFAVETFCSWGLILTSSRLWIEKWAWKIKYAYLFLRSGKLFAAFLIHKHRHEVKKGLDEELRSWRVPLCMYKM